MSARAANDEELRRGIKALNDLDNREYRVVLRRSRKGTNANANNLLARIR